MGANDGSDLCLGNRWLHYILPGQATPRFLRFRISLKAARHSNGLITDIIDPPFQDEAKTIPCLSFNEVSPHIVTGRSRRFTVKINTFVYGSVRKIGLQTAKTRDARHLGINDPLNQSTGDPRINRISTFLKNYRSRFHRLRLRSDNHAMRHGNINLETLVIRMMRFRLPTPTQCHWV